MKTHYKLGHNHHVVITLHGTGGEGTQLFALAADLDPQAHLVGIDGDSFENGLRRYFKRDKTGAFDQQDLLMQTEKLYQTIINVLSHYQLEHHRISIIGYSNGANIAISMLKSFPTLFHHVILLHPSKVRLNEVIHNENNVTVFASYGRHDPYVSETDFEETMKSLTPQGTVFMFKHDYGHQIIEQEIQALKQWAHKNH